MLDTEEEIGVVEIYEKGAEYEKLSDNDKLMIKFSGYYNSWDGTEWNEGGWFVCKPTQKTFTIYEQA